MDKAVEKFRKRRQERLDAKNGAQEVEYDSVAEFRKRRDARLKKRMDEEWVTIRGTHVMIDDNGQVSKGPQALKNVVKNSGGYKPKAHNPASKSGGDLQKYSKRGGAKMPNVKYNPASQKHGEAKWTAEAETNNGFKPKKGSRKYNLETNPNELDKKEKGLTDWAMNHGYTMKTRPARKIFGGNPGDWEEGAFVTEIFDKNGRMVTADEVLEAKKNHEKFTKKAVEAYNKGKEAGSSKESASFKSGGKTWDKESLTKLWQERGYSKKQAEARAEKDLKETLSAIKKNTESTSEELTGGASAGKGTKSTIKKSSSENDRKKQECDGTGYKGEPGVVKTGAKGNLAPKSEASKKVDTADALGELELYKKTNGQKGLPRNSMSDFIDENGNLTPERQKVHDEIIQKLFADKVPYNGQATMTMSGGGPASGKSFVSDNAKERFGKETVMVVDPDAIKAMLPGYADMAVAGDKAAGFYHEESSALAKRIYQYALDNNINVVYDGTGDGSPNSVMKKIKTARDAGYKVKGEYVTVDVDGEDGALVRNRNRYEHGKRDWEAGRQDIDPPRLVGDKHVREIHQKVSDIIPQVAGMFDEFTLIDNNVPKGAPKHLIATCKRGGEIQVVKGMEDKMQKCMDKGNVGYKVKDGKIVAP